VDGLSYATWILWYLGYPDQALKLSHEAVALAEGLSHPFSLAFALGSAALFHLLRREGQPARERAEAVMTLSTEQGFPYWLAFGTRVRGWALAEQGEVEEGIAQMQQGLAAFQAMGVAMGRTSNLAHLAEAYEKVGQTEEGLRMLAEALALVEKTGERYCEAELYRVKGELLLQASVQGPASQEENQKAKGKRQKSKTIEPQSPTPDPYSEAEACFRKAIEVARKQQAKSLELQATMSLARLWQQQGKQKEAHEMLAGIYGWFTEGFDSRDLQEAKTLLEELA
jgi:predicted ATPase